MLMGNPLVFPWPPAFQRWRARLRCRHDAASVVSATARTMSRLLVQGAASVAAGLPPTTFVTPGRVAQSPQKVYWPPEEDDDSDDVVSIGGDNVASAAAAGGDMGVVAVEDGVVGEEDGLEGRQGAEGIGKDTMGGDGEALSGGEQGDIAEPQGDGEEGEEEGNGNGGGDSTTKAGEVEGGSNVRLDSLDHLAGGGPVEEGDGEVEVAVAADEGAHDGNDDDDDDEEEESDVGDDPLHPWYRWEGIVLRG